MRDISPSELQARNDSASTDSQSQETSETETETETVRVENENQATDVINDIRSQASDEVQSTSIDPRDASGTSQASSSGPDNQQSRRQRTPRASQSRSLGTTGTPSAAGQGVVSQQGGERFGDSTGSLKRAEERVDPVSRDVSSRLRNQGQSFEEDTDRFAQQQDQVSDYIPALSGVTRASSEVGEALANVGADGSRIPSQAIEGAELVNYLASGTRITGAERGEFGERVGEVSDAAADAVGQTVTDARADPVDFATELAVGAATGTIAGRAARVGRAASRSTAARRAVGDIGDAAPDASSVSGRARAELQQLQDDFSPGGVDRGQLGPGIDGGNVKTADDIFGDRDPADGADSVEADGDQLMLTREREVTVEDAREADPNQPGDLEDDLQREFDAQEQQIIDESTMQDLREIAAQSDSGAQIRRGQSTRGQSVGSGDVSLRQDTIDAIADNVDDVPDAVTEARLRERFDADAGLTDDVGAAAGAGVTAGTTTMGDTATDAQTTPFAGVGADDTVGVEAGQEIAFEAETTQTTEIADEIEAEMATEMDAPGQTRPRTQTRTVPREIERRRNVEAELAGELARTRRNLDLETDDDPREDDDYFAGFDNSEDVFGTGFADPDDALAGDTRLF